MKVISPFVVAAALFSSVMVAAGDVEIGAFVGYDNNPYRLTKNQEASIYSEVFASGDASTGTLKTGKWQASGSINQLFYGSDGEYADRTKLKLRGKFSKKHIKLSGDRLDLAVEYSLSDSTYVERSTGLLADFSGFNTEDRYDATTVTLKNRYRRPVSDAIEIGLRVNYKTKDYEDYEPIGLYSLDYKQLMLQPGVAIDINERSTLAVDLIISLRDYDSRLAKDEFGDNIGNKELSYDYLGFKADYDVELSDLMALSFSYKHVNRTDNGGGYYDQSKDKLKLALQIKPDDRQSIDVSVAKSDTNFDKPPFALDLDEENRETKGYQYAIEYEYRIGERIKQPTHFVFKLLVEDYEDSDPVYSYDRNRILAGINKEF